MKTAEILLHPTIISASLRHVALLQEHTGMVAVISRDGKRGALVKLPPSVSTIKRN